MTDEIGNWLFKLIRRFDPSATIERILRLDFNGDVSLFWTTISLLHTIWEHRSKSKKLTIKEAKAILVAEINILFDSKFKQISEVALLHISL